MSVLARPQGTPERVWSFVGGLAALGGRAPRDEMEALFNPGYVSDGVTVLTKPDLAADTLGAATSLEVVGADRVDVWLEEGLAIAGYRDFADLIHDRLCGPEPGDKNGVILEAYAWVAAQSDKEGGLSFVYDWTREDFADRANEALIGEEDGGRLMNTTKVPAWRRWLALLGLSVAMPVSRLVDFPLPSARMARELQRSGLAAGQDLTASALLVKIAERQPYLDGGRLFKQACERIGHAPKPRRASPLLSAALRDLHDLGALELRPRGDSPESVLLTGDRLHQIQSFHSAVIGQLEAAA
jgi:hypothetical protein